MSVKTETEARRAGPAAERQPGGGGLNSAWLRRRNAVLLLQALRRRPGSSQREIAALTGLDKATVSAVTSQLVAAGIIGRAQQPPTIGRLGRPAIALDIPPTAGIVFGVRMEPDRIDVIAADLAGRILDRETRDGASGPNDMMAALRQAIDELGGRHASLPRRAVGIGVPALITKDGRLLFAPNLGWRDVALAELAAEHISEPVMIENDSKAAAIAERQFGSCRNIDDFVYVSGHSGVGGAVFSGGALYRGAEGLAGEIGHIKVVPDGRLCACGGRGCLEAYASEPALLKRLGQGDEKLTLATVAERAERGDRAVLAMLAATGQLIGRALAGVVNLLNPSRLVLGGDLAVVAPWMIGAIRGELGRSALDQLAAGVTIERSPLGVDAVAMGGVALALQRVDSDLLDTAILAG